MTTKVLRGGAPDNSEFIAAAKRCQEAVDKDENLVIYYDMESGWPSLITKDQQQDMINAFELLKPKVDSLKGIGGIFVFGTGGKH